MTSESINLFWDILETASLQEEAQIIVRNILKVTNMERLLAINLNEPQQGEEMAKTSIETNIDLRVRCMKFHNFRTFPEIEDRPYGIDFIGKNRMPCSLFLLGSNGTGKSSIFTALETFYTGKSSLAKERTVKENRYLSYAFREENNFNLEERLDVVTANNFGETNGLIATPASFCSSYDIQLLEKSDKGLTDYIFSQLGYDDVMEICDILESRMRSLSKDVETIGNADVVIETSSKDWHIIIKEYIRFVFDKKQDVSSDRKYTNEDVIRMTFNHMHDNTSGSMLFSEEWRLLDGEQIEVMPGVELAGIAIDQLQENQKKQQDVQIKRLAEMYRLFFQYYDHQDTILNPWNILDQMYKEYTDTLRIENKYLTSKDKAKEDKRELSKQIRLLQDVINAIGKRKEDVVHEFVGDFNSFVKVVLGEFSEDNEEFVVSFDESGKCEVKIRVTPEKGEPFETNPREYLNSFRFVLFCVVLKFSLALCQMKKKKVSIPIVIDDIFDASDFENSIKLEEFVYLVFKNYRKYVMHDGVDIPLQVILLTHDEMMKTAFERGLSMLELEDIHHKEDYICGRLIPYRYAKEDAEKGLTQTNDNTQFYNLYIPL